MMTLWIFQNFNSHWTNTITFTSKAFKFKMESYLFRPYTHRWYSTVQIFKIIYFITRQSIPEHKKYNKPYSKSVNFLLLWISNYRQSVIVIYSLLVYSHWIKYSQCCLPFRDDISMTRTTKEILFVFSHCLNGLFQLISCRKFISKPNIIVFMATSWARYFPLAYK